MDEITKGVVETTSVPENTEQLVKINIKDGKASALLFANPNGSKVKQRLDALEEKFNNLKTINYEELYGPGNINIESGGGSSVDTTYVDTQDKATLASANSYADSKLSEARDYADSLANTTLDQAKLYADSIAGGSSDGEKATVVLIDAVGRAALAREEAYEAYKAGKSIVVKVEENTYIPMTVVFDSGNTATFKGIDFNYTGYAMTPNDSLETRLWFLNDKGIVKNEQITPRNTCRTFDCTTSYSANTFANALDSYQKGYPILLKVDSNTCVIATSVTSSVMTGYSYSFNAGVLSDGQQGIVSVDITRWRFTSSGISKDVFSTENINAGGGSGGGTTIKNAFSTKETTNNNNDWPSNPDDDPTFWNQSAQTSSSVWAAQKSTGNDWVMWKLMPKSGVDGTNGKDGNGIDDVKKHYARSGDGTTPPTYPSSAWAETMPDADPGEYIWCRVAITYTLTAGETVYYTVSRIGKDGKDGAAGTPINIISDENVRTKEDLPTSGNTKGDGYLIDGDLWVYDGNTITSDKTYNGFTNVGRIEGPQGKTACFHQAWCNGDPANGDFTGFDVDAPDGSMFDYMGTYVDYVDSQEEASAHPDSTDPTKYKWVRIRGVDGEDAITLDFDNDSEGVGLTYDGLVENDKTITTNIGMFEGQKVMELQNISCDAPDGMVVSTSLTGSGNERYPGMLSITVKKGDSYINSGSNNIAVTVTAKCTGSSKTHVMTKAFHILGSKAGSPGESSVTYKIETSHSEIHRYSSGDYQTNFISVTKIWREIGNGGYKEYTGDYELRYDIDHQNKGYSNREKQTRCSLNYGVAVANVKVCLDFYLYINGNPADHEDIPVTSDGAIGETLKIINTEYRYAASMTFTKTPNDLTSWSEERIDIEPGQYLYIEEKRTWSDGSITYFYTWTRGGSNGYSNLPFISTVFTRTSTTPAKPTGGSFAEPFPAESAWSDGVPSGSAKLWMSFRKFTSDGLPPQESEWSEPESGLSSANITIKYSSFEECPKDPDTASSTSWVNIPTENSIWMAIQRTVNGDKQPWELRKIKGEKGSIDVSSAATPYMDEWSAGGLYCGNKLRTDIVKVSGTDTPGSENTYYYIANKAKNFGLDDNGVCVGEMTPQPGTTAGDSYWLKFGANFDNIATGFLFSEKIGTDIITAINATVDKIDAKNINVDNIVASKVKTANTGTRILIEENKLTAYDNNNQYLFRLDPGFNVDNNYTMEASYNAYKLPSSIVVGTVSGATTMKTVKKTIVNSFSVLPGTHAYVSNIGVRNLKYKVKSLYLKYGDVITADIYMSIDGDIFAKKSIEIRSDMCDYIYPDNAISIPIDAIESDYIVDAFADIKITLGSSTSPRIQPPMFEISVEKDTEIVSFYTYGLIIGNNGLRSGSIPLNKKVLIDAGSDNIFSAETERFGIKVNNGLFVKMASTGVYDMLRNPIVIDIQKDLPDGYITNEIMLRMRNAILDGIPVFFKSLVSHDFGNGNEIITVMWNINEMYSTGESLSSGELSFYSSVRLRPLSISNQSVADQNYFIANLFIKGVTTKTQVADTPFDGVGSISVNIERMYNTDYSQDVSNLINRVANLESWKDSFNNS